MEFYSEFDGQLSKEDQLANVIASLKALDDIIDIEITEIRGTINNDGIRREE